MTTVPGSQALIERSNIKPPSGILLIDKPQGVTSHDVVGTVRKRLRRRDVGHAGTLDPMATGLLVVLLGEATKLSAYLTSDVKMYSTTIRLGATTGSLDADGAITAECTLSPALQDELALGGGPLLTHALQIERSRISQVPPAVSAIQVDGVRSYDRARRGEEVVLPARAVSVTSIECTKASTNPDELQVIVDVSKGYYVRALARDVAETLGTLGYLTALRRLRSGPFFVDEATPLDGDLAGALLPLETVVRRALPAIECAEETALFVRQGKRFEATGAPDAGPFVAFLGDTPLAIAELDEEGRGKVLRGFV